MEEKTVQTRKKRKKRMRLPNGLGSVHLIGDGKSRRKPWRARVPSHVEIDEVKGTAKVKYITIGYFEKEADAIEALFNYRKNPYTIEAASATFADVFEMWKEKKYPTVSKASANAYNSTYMNSEALHNMKMRDIRSLHLEQVMNSLKTGYTTQARLKTFWGQLFKYAIEHDIVEKNYADFVATKDKPEKTKRTAIPDEEITKIWQETEKGDETAEVALIYIYTGLRLSELLEVKPEDVDLDARIMVGGMKTEAGKDRRIPIHNDILPFIEKRMNNENGYLIEGKGKHRGVQLGGVSFTRVYWNKLMEKLGIEECTPHYTRHTCATMLRIAGVEEDLRNLILGHASGDITDRYTHVPDKMLLEAIDKLPGKKHYIELCVSSVD